MIVVEKGYHANGRERIRPSSCFPDPRIAGTIAHGMTLAGPTVIGVSHGPSNVFVAGTVGKRDQGIFEKRRSRMGECFYNKFVGATLILHEWKLTA